MRRTVNEVIDEVADTGRRSRFLLTVAGSAGFFFGFGPTRLLFAIPDACLSPHGQPAQPLAGSGASCDSASGRSGALVQRHATVFDIWKPLIPDREWYFEYSGCAPGKQEARIGAGHQSPSGIMILVSPCFCQGDHRAAWDSGMSPVRAVAGALLKDSALRDRDPACSAGRHRYRGWGGGGAPGWSPHGWVGHARMDARQNG